MVPNLSPIRNSILKILILLLVVGVACTQSSVAASVDSHSGQFFVKDQYTGDDLIENKQFERTKLINSLKSQSNNTSGDSPSNQNTSINNSTNNISNFNITLTQNTTTNLSANATVVATLNNNSTQNNATVGLYNSSTQYNISVATVELHGNSTQEIGSSEVTVTFYDVEPGRNITFQTSDGTTGDTTSASLTVGSSRLTRWVLVLYDSEEVTKLAVVKLAGPAQEVEEVTNSGRVVAIENQGEDSGTQVDVGESSVDDRPYGIVPVRPIRIEILTIGGGIFGYLFAKRKKVYDWLAKEIELIPSSDQYESDAGKRTDTESETTDDA